MALLTRQQAAQSWVEADPTIQFGELLHALEHYKDVSTEYGLNLSVQHGWRFGDPHKKQQHQIGMITTSSFLMALSYRQDPSGITSFDG